MVDSRRDLAGLILSLGVVVAASFFVSTWASWTMVVPGVALGFAVATSVFAPLVIFLTNDGHGVRWRGLLAEEVHTGELLAEAGAVWTVQHRVELERFDVDHVATTASGVLAVETKWMTTSDPKWVAKHLAQTRRAAATVQSLMRSANVGHPTVNVHAVLVVWGGATAQLGRTVREVDGVIVIPGTAGPEAFARFGSGPLSRADAEQIGDRLQAYAEVRDSHRRRQRASDQVQKASTISSATRSSSARSSSAVSHSVGSASTPCAAPTRLPQIAPTESLSPEWFTAASRADGASGTRSPQ